MAQADEIPAGTRPGRGICRLGYPSGSASRRADALNARQTVRLAVQRKVVTELDHGLVVRHHHHELVGEILCPAE